MAHERWSAPGQGSAASLQATKACTSSRLGSCERGPWARGEPGLAGDAWDGGSG